VSALHKFRKDGSYRDNFRLISDNYSKPGNISILVNYLPYAELSHKEYLELMDVLEMNNFHILRVLNTICSQKEQSEKLGYNIDYILRSRKKSQNFLEQLIEEQIQENDISDHTSLFRGDSLLSNIFNIRAKENEEYLKIFSPLVRKLMSEDKIIEENIIAEYIEELFDLLKNTEVNFPISLKEFLTVIYNVSEKHFSGSNRPYIYVSSFLFLRLIIPALVTPKSFGIIEEDISETAHQNLILLTNCLRNLIYTESEFLNNSNKINKQIIQDFIKSVSSHVTNEFPNKEKGIFQNIAKIHLLILTYFDKIRNQITLEEQNEVKNFIFDVLLNGDSEGSSSDDGKKKSRRRPSFQPTPLEIKRKKLKKMKSTPAIHHGVYRKIENVVL